MEGFLTGVEDELPEPEYTHIFHRHSPEHFPNKNSFAACILFLSRCGMKCPNSSRWPTPATAAGPPARTAKGSLNKE
jgi:hypothetical protein